MQCTTVINNKGSLMKQLILTAVAAGLGSLLLPVASQAQVSVPEAQVNALEGLAGKQAGFRRSQAKGVCASGYFTGNADGRALSSATVFKGDRVPGPLASLSDLRTERGVMSKYDKGFNESAFNGATR